VVAAAAVAKVAPYARLRQMGSGRSGGSTCSPGCRICWPPTAALSGEINTSAEFCALGAGQLADWLLTGHAHTLTPCCAALRTRQGCPSTSGEAWWATLDMN
jgi:hypothetical protein